MSKLTEQLRGIGVFGGHNFAHGNVYIEYVPAGLAGPMRFYVTAPSPYGGWTCKEFGFRIRREKPIQFEAAQSWARERYGITEWARTPFGSWMDAKFVRTRMAELKRKLAEQRPAGSSEVA